MKKGFTLLELVVVIIILGILASLGLTQYGRMIERSRGAEARAALGDVRKYAIAYRIEYGSVLTNNGAGQNPTTNPELVGIGGAGDQMPNLCRGSHYFSYGVGGTDAAFVMTATRCQGGGKNPQGTAGVLQTLILTSDLTQGLDGWGGTGEY